MEKMLGDQIMGIERNGNQMSINNTIYQNPHGDSSKIPTKVVYTKYEVNPSS